MAQSRVGSSPTFRTTLLRASTKSCILNFEDLSPVQKTVEVEIPAELHLARGEPRHSEFGRHAKVPGFRPGKDSGERGAQPLRERDSGRSRSAASSAQSFREAVAEKGLEPVGEPQLEHSIRSSKARR